MAHHMICGTDRQEGSQATKTKFRFMHVPQNSAVLLVSLLVASRLRSLVVSLVACFALVRDLG